MEIITTKIVRNIETGAVIEHDWFKYEGPIDRLCGASPQQKEAFANETKISNLLTTQFQEFAGENQEILGSLTQNLKPIQEAGPSQFGLSPAEEAAERTMTAEQMAAAGKATTAAVRGAIASRGGGTTFLPSGSEDAILGSLAQDTAVKEALAQSKITERGYDIGRQNWEFATEGLMKAPGELESPVSQAGGIASGSAGQEMQGGTEISQANQAWMQPVGAIIGGVAGGLIPKIPGGKKGGCWVVSAVYGKNSPKTKMLWAWMTNPEHGWAQRSKIGKVTVWVYYKVGERVASLVQRYTPIRKVFKRIFDWVLVHKVNKADWLSQEETILRKAKVMEANGLNLSIYSFCVRHPAFLDSERATNKSLAAELEASNVRVRYMSGDEAFSVMERDPNFIGSNLVLPVGDGVAVVDCCAGEGAKVDMKKFVELYVAIQSAKKGKLASVQAAVA